MPVLRETSPSMCRKEEKELPVDPSALVALARDAFDEIYRCVDDHLTAAELATLHGWDLPEWRREPLLRHIQQCGECSAIIYKEAEGLPGRNGGNSTGLLCLFTC